MAEPPSNHENTTERRRRKTPWWEIAAVFIAFGLLLANWFQGCQTEKSADSTKETLHVAQRAYVDAMTPVMNVINDANGKLFGIGVRIEWENSGATRAIMVQHTSMGKFNRPLQKDFSFPDGCTPGEDCSEVQAVVPPHQRTGSFQSPITVAEVQLMSEGKKYVYCWG